MTGRSSWAGSALRQRLGCLNKGGNADLSSVSCASAGVLLHADEITRDLRELARLAGFRAQHELELRVIGQDKSVTDFSFEQEKLNIPLDKFIEIVLTAMQNISSELGL